MLGDFEFYSIKYIDFLFNKTTECREKSFTVLSVKDVILTFTAVHQYISQVVVKLDFQVFSKLKETRFDQGLKKARLVRRTRNSVNDKS